MHWDTALNFAWLAVGISLGAVTLRASGDLKVKHTKSWRAFVRCLALAATLFPFVSGSDDLIWLESRTASAEHQSTQNPNQVRTALSLLQVADAALPASPPSITPAAIFVALVPSPTYLSVACCHAVVSGRSPPPSEVA